jgi:hypothetical protein
MRSNIGTLRVDTIKLQPQQQPITVLAATPISLGCSCCGMNVLAAASKTAELQNAAKTTADNAA